MWKMAKIFVNKAGCFPTENCPVKNFMSSSTNYMSTKSLLWDMGFSLSEHHQWKVYDCGETSSVSSM